MKLYIIFNKLASCI